MAQTRTTVDPAEAIIAAIAGLGQASAADIATAAGVAYSTATRNLRELAAAGRVEKVADGKQSQWRLPATASPTANDDAGIAVPGPTAADPGPGETGPADSSTDAASADEPTDDSADVLAEDDGEGDGGTDDGDSDGGPVGGVRSQAGHPQDGDQGSDLDGNDSDQPDSGVADAAADAPVIATADAAGDEPGTPTRPDQDGDGAGPARVRGAATPDVTGEDTDGEATVATEPTGSGTNGSGPQEDAVTGGGATADGPVQANPAKPRRASGTLDGAVLDILEAHPDRPFKVSELCKLIDQANEGQDVSKASPGAVVLACQRLVRKGKATLAVEKPATFQLATAAATGADIAAATTGR